MSGPGGNGYNIGTQEVVKEATEKKNLSTEDNADKMGSE